MNKLRSSAFLISLLLAVSALFSQEEKSKEDPFKPSGKVWGYAFGDIFYKAASDTMVSFGSGEFSKVKKEYTAVTFRRIYLGYDYNIAPDLTAKILLESSDANLTSASKRTVFIKGMELEWKNIIPRASIFIGQTATPTWPLLTEKIWGYRSVEKTITDFRGFGSSNDLGIRISGKLDTAGVFGYSLMWGNGRGEKPEIDEMKKMYGSVDAQLFNKKLIMELYGDYEDLSRYESLHSNVTLKGFIACQLKRITLGIEVASQLQEKNKINSDPSSGRKDTVDKEVAGMTLFAKGNIIKDTLAVYARIDVFTPDVNYKKGDDTPNPSDEAFFLIGLDYSPNKNFHIMPNLWINAYQDKREKPENYYARKDYGKYYERTPDIVARMTFYYIFK